MSDRVELTSALCAAVAPTRQRRSAHDPGVVLRDLVVMLADGGDCLADLGALRDQIDLHGNVASDSTAFRVIDSIDEQCLGRLRCAVALSRVRARRLGARPERSLAGSNTAADHKAVLDLALEPGPNAAGVGRERDGAGAGRERDGGKTVSRGR